MCFGDSMHAFAVVELLIGEGAQDRGQDQAGSMNPGQCPVQFDGPVHSGGRYFGSENGIRSAGVIQARSRYPERHMEVAAGCGTVPACGPVGNGERRHEGGERNQAQALMCSQHVRAAVEPCLILGASLSLTRGEAQILWPPALAIKVRSTVCLEPGLMVTAAVLGAKPSAETTIW